MSVPGKSLQDIYDTGSKRLDDLEKIQQDVLREAGGTAVDDLGNIESTVMQKLDESLGDLEKEIREYVDKAMEGVQAAVRAEVDENSKFLDRLKEGLKLACRSLTEDVYQLKESVGQRFKHNSEYYLLMHNRASEKINCELKAEDSKAQTKIKELVQEKSKYLNNLTSSISRKLQESSSNNCAQFSLELSKYFSAIDKRIEQCEHSLSSRNKESLSRISTFAVDLQKSLDSNVQQILNSMIENYKSSEDRLASQCEEALTKEYIKQDEYAKRVASELHESYENTGSGTAEKLKTLKNDSNRLLDQVKQLINDVDFGVRENSNDLMNSFEQKLTDRMDAARGHQRAVSEERLRLMQRIAGDLREIESGFEKKLSDLAETCLSRLAAVCSETELAIIASHDNYAAEFRQLSAEQHRLIDTSTNELLSEIARLGEQALQNIRKAAGEKEPNSSVGVEGQSNSTGDIRS